MLGFQVIARLASRHGIQVCSPRPPAPPASRRSSSCRSTVLDNRNVERQAGPTAAAAAAAAAHTAAPRPPSCRCRRVDAGPAGRTGRCRSPAPSAARSTTDRQRRRSLGHGRYACIQRCRQSHGSRQRRPSRRRPAPAGHLAEPCAGRGQRRHVRGAQPANHAASLAAEPSVSPSASAARSCPISARPARTRPRGVAPSGRSPQQPVQLPARHRHGPSRRTTDHDIDRSTGGLTMSLSHEANSVNWLMANFVERTPGVEQAVAVSSDGLLLAVSATSIGRQPTGWQRSSPACAPSSQGASGELHRGPVVQMLIEMAERLPVRQLDLRRIDTRCRCRARTATSASSATRSRCSSTGSAPSSRPVLVDRVEELARRRSDMSATSRTTRRAGARPSVPDARCPAPGDVDALADEPSGRTAASCVRTR